MNRYIVRLRFRGPLHIGHDEARVGVESVQSYVHSDTLFSAFCNVWANDPRWKHVLDDIKSQKALFRFSSAFCYRQNDDGTFTYFLPRPLLPLSSSFDAYARTVKKQEFLTLEQFRAWASGNLTNDSQASRHLIGGNNSDYTKLHVEQIRPRHASDRKTMASSIYHCGEVFYSKDAGLYFLVETNEKHDLLAAYLSHLGYLGLGGERSVGYGLFDPELEGPLGDDSPFIDLKKIRGNAWCLLSLYYPSEQEMPQIEDSILAYNTVIRKGWFSSTSAGKQMKRKTCRMISEGSISKFELTGTVLDLRPEAFKDHPVYRSGLAFSTPIKIGEVD